MQPDIYYHVYNHANGGENLFCSEENYSYVLRQWAKYIEPIAVTYAYCLMPNHFHFLIKIKTVEQLQVAELDLTGFENLSGLFSKQFSNLFNSYSKAYNKLYDRRGSLFNRPFKRKEVTNDTYLTRLIHYIHHNPIHHRFCEDYQGWPHSSYHSYLSDKPTKIGREFGLEWFGGKEAFRSFHKEMIKYPKEIIIDD